MSIFCCQSFVLLLASSGVVFTHSCPNLQAPPKEVPKTIENQRAFDETTVDPEDEEVQTVSAALAHICVSSFTGTFKNLLHVSRLRLMKQRMSFLHISTG